MADSIVTRVVRALAAEKTHVVDAPEALLGRYRMLGSEFTGIDTPIVTRCGAKLGGGAVVCMEAGTRVACSRCRRLTGVGVAAADNTAGPSAGVAR